MRVLTGIVKFILLLGFLYVFICSLDVLSSAFQLVGGKNESIELYLYSRSLLLQGVVASAYVMCMRLFLT